MGFFADLLHGIGFISTEEHDAEVQRLSARNVNQFVSIKDYQEKVIRLNSELKESRLDVKLIESEYGELRIEMTLAEDRIAHYEAVITELRATLNPAIPPMRTTSGFVTPN